MKNLSWFVLAVAFAAGCGDNYPGIMQVGAGSGGSVGTVADASTAVSGSGGTGQADLPVLDALAPSADLAGSSDLGSVSNFDTAAVDTLAIDASSVSDLAIDAPLLNPDGHPADPQSCVGFRPNEYDLTSRCRVNANCPYGMFFCNGQSMLWKCVPVFGPDIWPGCFPQDAGMDGFGNMSAVDSGMDGGIDAQPPKIDSGIDLGFPDALPVADLPPPDVPLNDVGPAETVPMPIVDCLAVAGNPSLVTLVFSGYPDRALNAAVFDNLATASGKKQYCVVGDFNGWSGRLNCQPWEADPKTLTFPNIPARLPQANSRINLTLDLGNNTEQWVDDTRVIVQPGSRCTNIPGLNIVVN